jgi:hypothetical protein
MKCLYNIRKRISLYTHLSGQLFQGAILTRDNMRKRNWLGSPLCSLSNENETVDHLFFGRSNVKSVWGILGSILGTSFCPSSFWTSFVWLYAFYPRRKRFHILLLVAILNV